MHAAYSNAQMVFQSSHLIYIFIFHMKWQPEFVYKAKQVIVITICWMITGIVLELNNAVNYDPATGKHFLHWIFGKNAFEHLVITSIGPLAGGLIAGSFIVFYQREKVKGKTYLQKLFIHSLLYIFFVTLFIVIVGIIGAFFGPSNISFTQKIKSDLISLRVLRLLLNWYFIVILTIFILDVSEKYGTGILKNLLLGKYFEPVKENRIFMFLDLTSSTTIAEQIGDDKYFKMIRFFYSVANQAILKYNGEIYQYVGDEIVVSWPKHEGLHGANCLRCFTAIMDKVEENATIFKNDYGVVPQFKAGIHSGDVITGEIGITKKDIVYSGDVLNATARIVSLCNQYKQKLVVSEVIYNELKNTEGYRFNYLDSPVLRGKFIKLALYSVNPA